MADPISSRADESVRLLLTRPKPEAERTAAALRAMGHELILAPVLEIEDVADAAIGEGPYAAVLMTSGNAARAIARHPRLASLVSLECFAVGPRTADAARKAGFFRVVAAGGDGGDLARVIGASIADRRKPLLYLAGDDLARDMAAELAPFGLRLETVVMYRAKAAAALPSAITAAVKAGQIDGVMHYSRRSTAIFVDCIRAAGLEEQAGGLRHFCLSARASEPLAAINAKSILIAEKPDEAAMLARVSGT